MAGGQAFVAIPNHGEIIFGINASRPKGEVQEIIYVNSSTAQNAKIKCTYVEIDQTTDPVLSVILSKPGWAWGATSGSNEKGVAAGTIWQENYGGLEHGEEQQDNLVPIDFVRLCLERSHNSEQAINTVAQLLEAHGPNELNCQASYLIADCKEAWILNTAGKLWAAQLTTSGLSRFYSGMNVRKMDKCSTNIKDHCGELGFWKDEDSNSAIEHEDLKADFCITDMFELLRDKQRKAFRDQDNDYPTQNSHASSLSAEGLCCHWFTGTPDPSISVYKPFIFTPNAKISPLTLCDKNSDDYMHGLYKLHASGAGGISAAMLKEIESSCVAEVRQYIAGNSDVNPELDELMKDCVEAEVKFYR